jgi:RNA polymerase sigma-70 factor (ECF subfamily)
MENVNKPMSNFKGFYEEHREKLVSYLLRVTGDYYLSNDISQESFTRYLEHYGNHTKNVSLLYTIARNTLLDHFRRAKKDHHQAEDPEDIMNSQEHTLIVRQEYRQVLTGMQKLDKDERDILAMTLSGDLAYKDIASIVGISPGNVKVKVHRARMKLKVILGKRND